MKWLISCFLIVISASGFAQYKYYENGLEEYKVENYDKAITLFTQYFLKPGREDKIDVEVYYYRGLSFYKKADFKRALEDFRQSVTLNHSNKGNIHWFMAQCHMSLNSYNDAAGEYTQAIQLLSKDKSIHAKLLFERALAYEKVPNLVLAKNDLQEAVRLTPADRTIQQELTRVGSASTQLKNDLNKPSEGNNKPVEKPVEKVEKKEISQPVSKPVVVPTQPTLADIYANEKRYALVIGNSNYPKEVGSLKNPVNDATDIARELENSNFDVQLITNATYIQMREAMRKFHQKLSSGPRDQTVGLFYYAGHGVQHEDENYLVPVDAVVKYEDDIIRMCFPTQRMVLSSMEESNSRMNIVVLDACRNNPFPATTRSSSGGLTEMKKARGSFIAYATAPGSVASDGSGRNGLYTQELLKALRKPGLTIEQVFKDVRLNVMRLSGERQNTWDSSNIVGDFYFKFN
jgi:hypothetical protein